MAASDVRLPDDSGNLGKRVRTQDRVVGANTVQEHYFILTAADADVQPKIRAGSSAAVAADPSLVVALSPNSPLPVGANLIGNVGVAGALPAGTNSIGSVVLYGASGTAVLVYGTGALAVDASGSQVEVTPALATLWDTKDRAARLLGKAQILDSASALIDPALKSQLPGALAAGGGLKVEGVAGGVAQPVSIAAAIDVSDRAGRLAGVVTIGAGAAAIGSVTTDALKLTDVVVKAASTAAVAGDKSLVVALSPNSPTPAGANAIGSVAINAALPAGANLIGAVNLSQIGGTAIAIKALPTGGTGQAAIPVYTNAIQLLTYGVGVRALITAALVAGTAKAILSFEHGAASTKTMKLRRLLVSGRQTTILAGELAFQLFRGTAASSAGTAITPGPRVPGDAAAEAVVKSLPTIVAATLLDTLPFAAAPTAAANAQGQIVIYDWQEAGETKPWTLRAGFLDSIVLSAISDAAQNWTLVIHATFTEE